MRLHRTGKWATKYVCLRERLAIRDKQIHPTILQTELERIIAEAAFMALTVEVETGDATDDAAPLRVERADLSRRRKVAQQLAEMPGADLDATAKRLMDLGRQIEEIDVRVSGLVSANSRASLLAAAREALVEHEFGTAIMGRAMFSLWLPRWEATPIEKRQALIRDMFGPITLDFESVHLTKTDQEITREKRTPETWQLNPALKF
jgi:hypothetical protein